LNFISDDVAACQQTQVYAQTSRLMIHLDRHVRVNLLPYTLVKQFGRVYGNNLWHCP